MLKDAYHNTCLDYWAHNNNNNNNHNNHNHNHNNHNNNNHNNNHNHNHNNNNGLLTVHPPSGSSPVKNYKLYKKWKTIIYYKKNWIEIYNIKSKNIGL